MHWVSNIHAPGGRIWGCYLYFFCCVSGEPETVYIKIGISSDPNGRMHALLTSCPLKAVRFGIIRVKSRKLALHLETLCHRRFKAWRIRGEWFKFKSDDRNKFQELRSEVLDRHRSTAWPMKLHTVDMIAARKSAIRRKNFMAKKIASRGLSYKDFQSDSLTI